MANTLQNWSHLVSASMANQAAVANLHAAMRVGIAAEMPADTKGSVYAMEYGKKVHYQVDDPFILSAISGRKSFGMVSTRRPCAASTSSACSAPSER